MDENKHDNKSALSDLKDEIVEYAELRAELAKLSTFELLSKAVVSAMSMLILLIFAFFFLFFIFLAAGFYFGELLNSPAKGFLIVAFFYFVLALIYILIRKRFIENPLRNTIIDMLSKNESENE